MVPSSFAIALALGPLLAVAGPLRRSGNDSFSFTMYESSDCSGPANGPITGTNNEFPMCSDTLPHSLGSVFVASNAAGSCPISFYTKANAMMCFHGQANQPNFRLGHCYTFDPHNRPTSYGVQC